MTKTISYTSYGGGIASYECLTQEDFPGGANNNNSTFAIETRKASKQKNDIPFYLEIGASNYKNQNDTYILEKEHGWSGISIEIEEGLSKEFNENRSNICVNADAISVNWDQILDKYNAPKRIDFLQIDIDMTPRNANLLALINLPMSRYRFNSIVIEHSVGMDYTFDPLRAAQRYILTSLGYRLVNCGHNDDWWVDETSFDVMQTLQITSMR
jgi:hypothetical protein